MPKKIYCVPKIKKKLMDWKWILSTTKWWINFKLTIGIKLKIFTSKNGDQSVSIITYTFLLNFVDVNILL